jgi:hypothetical protein
LVVIERGCTSARPATKSRADHSRQNPRNRLGGTQKRKAACVATSGQETPKEGSDSESAIAHPIDKAISIGGSIERKGSRTDTKVYGARPPTTRRRPSLPAHYVEHRHRGRCNAFTSSQRRAHPYIALFVGRQDHRHCRFLSNPMLALNSRRPLIDRPRMPRTPGCDESIGRFVRACTGCFWGKADIERQVMPVDPVENDPKETSRFHP